MANEAHPRLAVILHADVVESTTLVRQDERLAHQRIQAVFRDVASLVGRYGGTVNELRGDALVAEFSRASDAVLAALAAQEANRAHLSGLEDFVAPVLRMGIALGEVVIADTTVTGPGVVLAQRLEQIAAPGGVCVSAAVREAVPERLPLDYDDLGEQAMKGFDDPVHAYALLPRPGEVLPRPSHDAQQPRRLSSSRRGRWIMTAIAVTLMAGALVTYLVPLPFALYSTESFEQPEPTNGRPSIAVMAFANRSDDASQEYFSDGLTEDIITDLSRISRLFVIARNSSFAYKGRDVHPRQIGRELGVHYVLEGSVRKAGDRLRVTARLTDTSTARELWAARYDRNLDEVFTLQDELAETIVTALSIELTPAEDIELRRRTGADADAYDMLLRGNEFLNRFSPSDNAMAREFYHKAIALNPGYARAHANLALTHGQDAQFFWTDDQQRSIRLGLSAAAEARRLDEHLPQLHFALSSLHNAAARFDEGARAARRALELNPSYADGAAVLAVSLTFLGDLDGAMSAIQLAKRLNPRFSYVYIFIEGRIQFLLGHYNAALAAFEEAALRNPEFESNRVWLAATYGQLGRIDDAEWAAEEVLALRPGFGLQDMLESEFRAEFRARLAAGLRAAGLPE
jgi:adenylate cyclase